jgi:hypothetical protein
MMIDFLFCLAGFAVGALTVLGIGLVFAGNRLDDANHDTPSHRPSAIGASGRVWPRRT